MPSIARAEALSGTLRDFDEKMDRQRAVIAEKDGGLQRLEGEKNVLQSSIDHNAANIERVREELSQQESRKSSLSAQIEKNEQRIGEIEALVQTLDQTLSELETGEISWRRPARGLPGSTSPSNPAWLTPDPLSLRKLPRLALPTQQRTRASRGMMPSPRSYRRPSSGSSL